MADEHNPEKPTEKRSGIDRVMDELKSPWDWVAALVGGAGGLLASGHVGHLDGGQLIPGGALGAISARRAAVASVQRPVLRRRGKRLIKFLETQGRFPDLVDDLRDSLEKWNLRIISNEDFEKRIAAVAKEDSKRKRPDAY
jgi:hypothetical protein